MNKKILKWIAHSPVLSICLGLSLFVGMVSMGESSDKASDKSKKTSDTAPDVVKVNSPAVYPEGVEWDARHNRFLVSSLHKGVVGAVTDDGKYRVIATDTKLIGTVGMELDPIRDRLLVCNSDGGASEKSNKATTGKVAGLAVFKISTGKLIKYVNLVQYKDKDDGHFCNDIAIDKDGTAYITDSFSPVIYKVDRKYKASVLIKDKTFSGPSFNLNGIVIKDDYLLVNKMNSGQLFKIPLKNPKDFNEVKLPEKLEGADGMLWAPDGTLIVIANNNAHVGVKGSAVLNSVFRLSSDDGWKTAMIKGKAPTGDVFATTGTIRNGQIYVMHAMLHVLFNPNTKEHLKEFDIVKYSP